MWQPCKIKFISYLIPNLLFILLSHVRKILALCCLSHCHDLSPASAPIHVKFCFLHEVASVKGDIFILWTPLLLDLYFYHDHQNGKSHHLLTVHYMPNIGLYPLHTLFHLMITGLRRRLYYPYFTGEKTDFERYKRFAQNTQLLSGRSKVHT